MAGYLFRRLLQSVLFLTLAALVIYTVLVVVMPGGPKAEYDSLSRGAAADQLEGYFQARYETVKTQYKLDKPWPLSFLAWLFDPADTTEFDGNFDVVPKGIDLNLFGLRLQGSGILTGSFGKSTSYAQGVPVAELIGDRWDHTVLLIIYSLLLTVVVALPLGIIGAVRHRKSEDHAITLMTLAGQSIPAFVLGLLLVIFLSVLPNFWNKGNGWGWMPFFPPGGLGDRASWVDRIYHMTLPAVTLALPQIAWLARYSRLSMLDVMKQDYVRTAWAKGLARRRVVLRHALRNALLPLITLIGLAVPGIASTAIVVETVFNYQGLGQLFYRGIGGCLVTREGLAVVGWGIDPPPCPAQGFFPIDFPVILTLSLVLLTVITLASFLADVVLMTADPRVKLDRLAR
jgi:peptide/nickel transport system permease protein